jgi:hypothetical protein
MVNNFLFLYSIAQVVMPVLASKVVSLFSQASVPVLSYFVLDNIAFVGSVLLSIRCTPFNKVCGLSCFLLFKENICSSKEMAAILSQIPNISDSQVKCVQS